MEDKEKLEIKAVLRHCIGVLDVDGINSKAKVKNQLKRLLEIHFKDDEKGKSE